MNNKRDYTDQVINFLNNDSKKKKELAVALTEEYYHSDGLKDAVRNATLIIGEALGYAPLGSADFDACYQTALTEFLSNHPIEIITSQSLKKSSSTWLTAERNREIPWNYTDRYFTFLKRTGRSEKVIAEVEKSSRKILEKMGDPKSGKQFYTRGLVVGSVQSGKTANFNAVINRALDSGYALIIVLSGIMEDLRVQTQGRIEREVSGTDRSGKFHVGMVKKFGEMGDSAVHQVVVPTSLSQDFKKTIKQADFSLNNKNILVCKKNTGVLKNLILWLDDYLTSDREKHDIPFLIIDDEADNASLNNMGKKGKEYASAVNALIRALLGLFNRKTYIGYTATPFANVLQDRNEAPESKWPVDEKVKGETVRKEFEMVNNIFPDDFIELLFPPSNYIGAKHFFETRTGDIKKIEPLVAPAVIDYNASFPSRINRDANPPAPVSETDEDYPRVKKDDDFPKALPQSLKDAIQCFIISTAVRLSRKPAMSGSKLYNPHNTMLIHVSRFTAWQTRTKVLVEKYVNDDLTIRLNNDLPRAPTSVYAEFERTWFKYYAHIIDNIKSYLPDGYDDEFLVPKSFEADIKPLLVEAVKGIEIKAVNSETKDSLSFPENSEKKYIAIGGNRLSRGFTLEGLTINYFIRSTDYADTLLQMGRWFGYRPGYIDCCKLFTTRANINKFDLTTLTVEALEQEFDTMSKNNRTPADFVLRVRTHPKVLHITRASIIKKTIEEKVNYSGDIEQSTKFYINATKISAAWDDFISLAQRTPWETDDDRDFFIYKTNSKGLLEFLRLRNTFAGFEIPGLSEYLQLCNKEGKLTDWTIAVKRNTSTKNKILLSKEKSGLPQDINLTIRRGPKEGNARDYLLNDSVFKASGKSAQIVAAGADFSLTLSLDEKIKAEEVFLEQKVQDLLKDDVTLTRTEAVKKVKGTTIPDKAYRSAMAEKDGILVIYLIDLERVFESKDGETDTDLQNYLAKKDLDISIPLVGYALGFPRVSGDIGGTYVRGDYNLEEMTEETEEEFDDALNEENS